MKHTITFLGAISIVVATFFASRIMTVKSITSQNAIFDTFEQIDKTWLYSDKIGAAAASDIERARVAIGGPLGLSSKEAVYFVATQDDEGKPLQSHCTYRVTGQRLDTRWWSLTLYDSLTQHYVPNTDNRSSWNSISIPVSDSGDWVLNVAPTPQDTAWLPSGEAREKSFELMLRVYNPSDAMRELLPNIRLPIVERMSC